MSNLTEEQMEEMKHNKEVLKEKNVDAVSQLLMEVRDMNRKVMDENIDLKRMVTNNNQEISLLKGEIAALKAMGFHGSMGTGSTVHAAGE